MVANSISEVGVILVPNSIQFDSIISKQLSGDKWMPMDREDLRLLDFGALIT